MKKLLFILFLMFSIFNLSAVELTLDFDSEGQNSHQKDYTEYNDTTSSIHSNKISKDCQFIVHKPVWIFFCVVASLFGLYFLVFIILAITGRL